MVTTNFFPIRTHDAWEMQELPMIASVAIASGSAVYWVGDGTVTKVTNATGNFAGILVDPIAATDADYATSRKKKNVLVPKNISAEAEFTVGAGTFTTADEGDTVKFNDETGLAVDTAGTQARITKYLSSTRGRCVFNLAIS
jgi:hypothetical protein